MLHRAEPPTAKNSSNMNRVANPKHPIGTTLDNLKAAVTGETGASAKYAAYAKAADAAGKTQVAKLFRAASAAEQVHITLESNLIRLDEPAYTNPKADAPDVPPIDLALLDAALGEMYETSDMYPGYIEKAVQEDKVAAEEVFTRAKLAESVHAELFLAAYNDLDAADDAENFYLCPNCGYIHKGAITDPCPICYTAAAMFKEF